MRTFISGTGADVTATVNAALAAGYEFKFADLYLLGDFESPTAQFLTNWDTPLLWGPWGTFQPTVIKRDKITSQVGLQVDTLSIEWSPIVGSFTHSTTTGSPYQLAQAGFYDNKQFRLWRCIMPTPGDANTYGACEYFGGRIADTTIERGRIKFNVNSFLDVVNQKVPPNVIEHTNTLAHFAGATPVTVDAETAIARFQVVSPSSAQVIIAKCLSPTANKVYGNHKFQYGYLVFEAGTTLAGLWSAIADNISTKVSGTNYNEFQTYSQFPWDPTPGDTFYAATQPPINLQDANAGFAYVGFPYVPDPENAI